jgi:ubiquinone/menaquinone biosynthesis C-methylase UbiE
MHEVLSELQDESRELERIRAAYERRRNEILQARYSRCNPAQMYLLHERENAMLSLLGAAGIKSFAGSRVLDVGCGRGSTLRGLLEYGADPGLLTGVDLLQENIDEAQRLSPHIKTICCNASHLPLVDASVDLVFQFLLFTSVLDREMKRQIAAEIMRVLVRGGRLIWYDFAYNNPNNPDVRGIGKHEIQRLFPGFKIHARRVTVAPPLGRFLAKFGPAIYSLAAHSRFLCTHHLCLLQKP